MKTATLKCNLPQFEQPLHTAAASSPSLWPLNLIHIIIIVFACSSWQHLLGALLSSAAFSLAISFSCCCLLPSPFSFPPFARLAHLNVFSWHLHRHSIRLISFSCHSQWVDESLGCLLLDSCSIPARVLVLSLSCLLLCGSYCVPGRFGSSCVFLITFN